MSEIKEMNLILNYQVPITESAMVNDRFIIKGRAINETTTSNGHKFLAEELRPAAGTLKGVPLLVDHDNRVECIKGRVLNGSFNEMNPGIDFEANVVDKNIREMIKDGRLNSVSVGAVVKGVEEAEDGIIIPRGIQFKELSLVAVPADGGATFNYAFHEAYNAVKSQSLKMPITPEVIAEVIHSSVNSIQSNSSAKEEITINERRQKMEEQKTEVVDSKFSEMSKALEEANKKIAEYEAEKRKALEARYAQVCESKGVKALDVSKLDDAAVNLMMEQVSSIKIAEKVESKTEETKTHGIIAEHGSLFGGSFTNYW